MWRGAILVSLLLLAAVVTRWGGRPSTPRPVPVRRIAMRWPPESLAALPIAVAEASGWVRRADIRLVDRPAATVVANPEIFPVRAVLLQRPDWVLVSPDPDPDFRWRDIVGLPLPVVEATPIVLRLADHVLEEHGVPTVTWDRLSVRDALRLLAGHHLPWLLVPLTTAEGPFADRAPYALAYLGAATGPLPWTVVAGGPPLPPRLLSVLNRALLWLRTTDAVRIAERVQAFYPNWTRARLAAAIATAQGLDLFPLTIYPTRALYAAGEEWLADPQQPWPPYAEGVDLGPVEQALKTWVP